MERLGGERPAKKRNRKKVFAAVIAACMLAGTATPQATRAASLDLVTDKDGSRYAQDTDGFVYYLPKTATEANGCKIYMYGGTKTEVTFPQKCNTYTVTAVGSNLSQVIMTKLKTVKIPSGYTTIEDQAFQNQTDLYRIEIPASVKSIGKNAFAGCDKTKLTIVTTYGSAAEKYAKANGIFCAFRTTLQINHGYSKMYVGEKKQIAVLNNGNNATWKSSNSSVISVDQNGNLTAKKAGSAKITVTIGAKTYTYPHTVVKRTKDNVLNIIWNAYVTPGMSDYEKAVAAQQWMEKNVSMKGTATSAKSAFTKGKVNDQGFCSAYKTILAHYGISAKVVSGTSHKENSVVIAGKKYTASTLAVTTGVNQTYTTTTIPKVVLNKSTMNLSVGKTGTFQATGSTAKITWSSSNGKVATVNAKGKVTAKGAGTATITLKSGGKTYACTVRVNP